MSGCAEVFEAMLIIGFIKGSVIGVYKFSSNTISLDVLGVAAIHCPNPMDMFAVEVVVPVCIKLLRCASLHISITELQTCKVRPCVETASLNISITEFQTCKVHPCVEIVADLVAQKATCCMLLFSSIRVSGLAMVTQAVVLIFMSTALCDLIISEGTVAISDN